MRNRIRALPALARWSRGGIILLLLAGSSCSEPAEPQISLIGLWDLVAFTDAGVAATAAGTAAFGSNGTFSVEGTITFPGEPTDSVSVSGTYRQTGNVVRLTAQQESNDWRIQRNGDQVILTEDEPPPANSITLRRRS
jgi:hypothetical protein